MRNIQLILKNFNRLLKEKTKITIAEAEHIQRSIKFIKKGSIDDSQFKKDTQTIYEGLNTLIEKLKKHEEDIDTKLEVIDNLETLNKSNKHLECLIMLDCMQSRSYSFAEKLEYLHNGYKNLVDNYQYPYIPTPNINKRIKTSNLTLYFNKILNVKLETLKHFFGLRKTDEMNIFSTWSFFENEHLKELDSTNNEYISFSFWFFEKQIFYPIAYHEIAHALYKHNKHTKFKLTVEDEAYIAQKLFFDKENRSFSKSFLYSIYEDMIADISAYSMVGESYIHALFYTGFFEKFHTIFYEDLFEKSITDKQRINDNERKCSSRHENLTLMTWKTTPQFQSFFARMKVLLAMHKSFTDKGDFSAALDGIEKILNLIYPDSNVDLNYNSFEEIVSDREKQKNEYQYSKNFTLLLSHLFVDKILKNKVLLQSVTKIQKREKRDFQSNKDFSGKIKNYLLNSEVSENFINRYKKYISLYDFSWDYRYQAIGKDKVYIPLGRFLRLYNISQLHLTGDFNDLDHVVYELTLFKFKNENSIKDIFGKEYLLENNDRLTYAFGPYDSVVLNCTTTTGNDQRLQKMDSRETYFTERHALFQLSTKEGRLPINGLFDLLISVSMRKEFIAGDTSENGFVDDYIELEDIIANLDDKYNKVKFFISMGHENFLIYIYGLDIRSIQSIVEPFSTRRDIIKDIHSTVLLNDTIWNDNARRNIQATNFSSIIFLCKLKDSCSSKIDEIRRCLCDVYSKKNIGIYKLYGVYDLKIRIDYTDLADLLKAADSIGSFITDLQIEYQPEI